MEAEGGGWVLHSEMRNKEPYGDNDHNKIIRVIKKMKRVINFPVWNPINTDLPKFNWLLVDIIY